MTRLAKTICLVCMFALLTPAFAFGTLIVYDGFDYTAGESMDGQNGGSGWDSAWDVTASGTGYATVQDASLVDGCGNYFTASGSTSVVIHK